MRHKVATFKIGRSGAHRRAMLANMVSSLFEHGRIETTIVKAKAAASFAERLITLGKKGEIHHRRLAFARLRNKEAVKTLFDEIFFPQASWILDSINEKLFDEIAPAYTGRQGGYTRIFKLGKRRGDAAEICILMLVEEAPAAKAE